jgi:uracil-DNA glycosylase family 4
MKPLCNFPITPECTDCPLHETSDFVGAASRCIASAPENTKAVIFIGQNPPVKSADVSQSFTGWSGRFIERLTLEALQLDHLADIYGVDAVRCCTPENAPPKDSHLTKCRSRLEDDLRRVIDAYGAENVVLCCLGSRAAKAIANKGLTDLVAYQGSLRIPHRTELPALPVFFTYHPSMLAPRRDPAKLSTVMTHLKLLKEFVASGTRIADAMPDIEAAPTTLHNPPVIALDIETYGILKTKDQTVFHPIKSAVVDGIPPGKQVICASVAWEDAGHERVAFYNFTNAMDRRAFERVLAEGAKNHATLVGMNIGFDLMYLRANYPRLRWILQPKNFYLEDGIVLNHLDDDMRPEHSLKALAHLFNTANYLDLQVSTLPTGHGADNPHDPNLAIYNCMDTIATLRLYKMLTANVTATQPTVFPAEWYAQFRSDLLWTLIEMSTAGVCFDRGKLEALHTTLQAKIDRLTEEGKAAGYIFNKAAGPKSQSSCRELITSALQAADLLSDDRVVLTDKTKQVSTNKANVKLILSELDEAHPLYAVVSLLNQHNEAAALVNSYTRPLLLNPRKGCLESGMAYPSWFPVPMRIKGSQGREGGTKQGRLAAHAPAVQTLPRIVKATMCSRFPNGELFGYDFSQIELRMAACLSGDEAMVAAYLDPTRDLHEETARLIWPDLSRDDEDYDEKRQVGKTGNFLVIYRGGAKRFQAALRSQIGLEVSDDFARDAIRKIWEGRQGLQEWQNRLIAEVNDTGRLILPTGWKRTFARDTMLNETTYINEICNCPVQTLSAQLVLSAQAEILRQRAEQQLAFVMPLQTHDDITIDCLSSVATQTRTLVEAVLENPPLWARLKELYTAVPLKFQYKSLT